MNNLFVSFLFVLGFANLSASSMDLNKININNAVEDELLIQESSTCIWDKLENTDLDKVKKVIFVLDNGVLSGMQLNFVFDKADQVYKNRRKKKKEKAAAIFYGLANAATSLAQAVGGKPKEGVTNFVGAIFGAAAQIAQIEANYTKYQAMALYKNPIFFDLMIKMTESLYEIISTDNSIDTTLSRLPTLKELSVITVYAQRIAWVADKILNNDFVQTIIKESLEYLEIYLHEQVNEAIEYLKEKLLIDYKEESFVSSD